MTLSLAPLQIFEFVTNVLMMVLSVYAIAISSRIVKGRPNVSLWLFLHWQVIALGTFAFSHSIGHILKRILLMAGHRGLWEFLSPFTGGINSMTFVVVGMFTFLYKDMKMASERYEALEEAGKNLAEYSGKLRDSYRKLEDDAALIAKQNADLWLANKELDEASARLKEANYTLAGFFEALPDGAFIVDRDMVVRAMNSQLAYFAPEIRMGDKCYTHVGGSHSKLCLECGVKKTFEDGLLHDQDAILEIGSGEKRHIRNLCAPIKDEEGRVVMAVSVLRDVTERVELTDRLLRQNEELRVLDRAKSNFIDIASHELRTPLSSILGYVHLLVEGEKKAEGNKAEEEDPLPMLESVQRSSYRLKEIIDDLLDVARIESGKLSFKRGPLRLNSLIEGVLSELDPFCRQRGQNVIRDYADDLPEVDADFNRFSQVFYNLLSNAIKYTPDGGVIRVGAELADTRSRQWSQEGAVRSLGPERPDTMLHITVSDTGIGIPREDLDRVFERFYEVGDVSQHSSGKSKFMGGGTGLGLSIAKGIVEGHGGRIWAESSGRDEKACPGSKFHILLPVVGVAESGIASVPAAEELTVASPAEAAEPVEAAVKPLVLLVEDDKDIAKFTCKVLGRHYNVEVSEDGMDGIKKAFDLRPALILLDIWMYGLDGYEVCRILKSNPHTKDVLIAFFTASAQKAEIEKGYEAGADDYITKPFKPDELLERVEKLLSMRDGMAAGMKGA